MHAEDTAAPPARAVKSRTERHAAPTVPRKAGTAPPRTVPPRKAGPAGPRKTGPAARRATGPDDRRLGMAALVIAVAWAVAALYVIHSQLPNNTLALPGEDRLRTSIRAVAPQGWAFFTRSPRDPDLVAWRPAAGRGWESAMDAPHAEPRNAFGFNRRSRAQPVELALLANGVPIEQWRECDSGDVPACLATAVAVPIDNPSPHPLLCGPVGLSRQEPLPWAWIDAAETTRMPATVLRLEVQC
jgi:antimicrobial peptide system SdpA family protein